MTLTPLSTWIYPSALLSFFVFILTVGDASRKGSAQDGGNFACTWCCHKSEGKNVTQVKVILDCQAKMVCKNFKKKSETRMTASFLKQDSNT